MQNRPLDRPLTPAHFLGQELTRRREARGWKLKELGVRVGVSVSRVSQIETAVIPPNMDTVRAIDNALDDPAPGFFERYWQFVNDAPLLADWFTRYVELEQQAVAVREYAATLVPGVLQTEEYASALLHAGLLRATPSEIELQIAARLERQTILRRDPMPPLWYILDENVITRPVGGKEVMAKQLEYLHGLAVGDEVVIQVLPVSVGAHPSLGGLLSLLYLPDAPPVAYLEGFALGQLVENGERFAYYQLIYDHLQALALGSDESACMIRSAMEDMKK
ncbi:DUF5753 domain-containing protein [Streptomyces chrestomyceticus]|uniref:DUF5753 domain-containing protein n=1 Tax=Streptomyces chrestomyceticus TaxID=68185 RepID=UPI00379993C8